MVRPDRHEHAGTTSASLRGDEAGNVHKIVGEFIRSFKVIVFAGLLLGTLDGAAAVILYLLATGDGDPIRVFQYIASGVFGRDAAFEGGLRMALRGVVFHYLIAFIWTVFFFFVYPTIKKLSINKFITGIAYGLFIWLVMNLVVVPLSNAPNPAFDLTRAVVGVSILIVCVGLPISLIIDKYNKASAI